MTDSELRDYIKDLSSKPCFWVKNKDGGYFDIVEFGLALAEVIRKEVK
jgi:hypothetical protein